jgi:hypothetical protein
VAPGGHLELEIGFHLSAPGPFSVTVHLPEGATFLEASGTGWAIAQTDSPGDAFQSAPHVDLSCASATSSVAPPPIRMALTAPREAGALSTCVELDKAHSGNPPCITGRVE